MDFEIIWRKIQEFAMWFFHFAMNEGENKFMLVDQNLLRVDKINSQTMTMYFGAFLIVALITIFATDSFHPFRGFVTKISYLYTERAGRRYYQGIRGRIHYRYRMLAKQWREA